MTLSNPIKIPLIDTEKDDIESVVFTNDQISIIKDFFYENPNPSLEQDFYDFHQSIKNNTKNFKEYTLIVPSLFFDENDYAEGKNIFNMPDFDDLFKPLTDYLDNIKELYGDVEIWTSFQPDSFVIVKSWSEDHFSSYMDQIEFREDFQKIQKSIFDRINTEISPYTFLEGGELYFTYRVKNNTSKISYEPEYNNIIEISINGTPVIFQAHILQKMDYENPKLEIILTNLRFNNLKFVVDNLSEVTRLVHQKLSKYDSIKDCNIKDIKWWVQSQPYYNKLNHEYLKLDKFLYLLNLRIHDYEPIFKINLDNEEARRCIAITGLEFLEQSSFGDDLKPLLIRIGR